jgi:hypothetical protein
MSFIEGTPTITIELGGPHELGFTLGAMGRIQEKLGSLDIPSDKAAQLAALPTYVWACLSVADRGQLTIEQIAEMIHPGNLEAISTAVMELFEKSQPPKGAEGNGGRKGRKVAASR